MKSKIFGSLVASAVVGVVLASSAMAEEKAAGSGSGHKSGHAGAAKGWCQSNECKGTVAGAKNECKGKMACKGIKKDDCEKDQKGTWSMDPKPK